jgi:hypothetical protein
VPLVERPSKEEGRTSLTLSIKEGMAVFQSNNVHFLGETTENRSFRIVLRVDVLLELGIISKEMEVNKTFLVLGLPIRQVFVSS